VVVLFTAGPNHHSILDHTLPHLSHTLPHLSHTLPHIGYTLPHHSHQTRSYSTDLEPTLSHIDSCGNARMVDVTGKGSSIREARASGHIGLSLDAFNLVLRHSTSPGGKGDVVGVARLAGIMAAKNTSQLIPLCHTLSLTHVSVDFDLCESTHHVVVRSCVRCEGVTGVEMEALTAVGVALLTVYDMTKAVSKSSVISEIRLEGKTGGKTGDFIRRDTQCDDVP